MSGRVGRATVAAAAAASIWLRDPVLIHMMFTALVAVAFPSYRALLLAMAYRGVIPIARGHDVATGDAWSLMTWVSDGVMGMQAGVSMVVLAMSLWPAVVEMVRTMSPGRVKDALSMTPAVPLAGLMIMRLAIERERDVKSISAAIIDRM